VHSQVPHIYAVGDIVDGEALSPPSATTELTPVSRTPAIWPETLLAYLSNFTRVQPLQKNARTYLTTNFIFGELARPIRRLRVGVHLTFTRIPVRVGSPGFDR